MPVHGRAGINCEKGAGTEVKEQEPSIYGLRGDCVIRIDMMEGRCHGIIYYKIWTKYNEIQLTKNKMN